MERRNGKKSKSKSKSEQKRMVEIRTSLFPVTDDNGFVFNENHTLPTEILELILSYVHPKDLVFNCRGVCKNWCNVIDSRVWDIQLKRYNFEVTKSHPFKWVYYYWILSKKYVFNENLVINTCGERGYQEWADFNALDNRGKEPLWVIEKPPVGCASLPEDMDKEFLEHNSCFATRGSSKWHYFAMDNYGLPLNFMDIVKPRITFSEWFCGRYDYSSSYSVEVLLVNTEKHELFSNSNKGVMGKFKTRKNVGGKFGSKWQKVSHVFENYKDGVDTVMIENYCTDSKKQEGCYGCKITGTSIVLSLP